LRVGSEMDDDIMFFLNNIMSVVHASKYSMLI